MSKRKKVTLDAIADEMGAVAAFARSSPTAPDGAGKGGNGQALVLDPVRQELQQQVEAAVKSSFE